MNSRESARANICVVLILLGAMAATLPDARAMSGTSQVASPGKPVAAVTGWPEGVLDLVNDPLRTDGWNPWFSQMANDVNFYAFKVRDTDDVNRLIQKLMAIKAPKVHVQLNPGSEATYLGYTTVLEKGNGAAAVFFLGNQQVLNDWYQRRKGKLELKEAPTAEPPTLILYAGNLLIDLGRLKILPAAEVSKNDLRARGDSPPDAAVVKAIEDFIAKRKSKPVTAATVATVRGVVEDENGTPQADVKVQVCGQEKLHNGVGDRGLARLPLPSYSADKEGRFVLPFHYTDTRYDLYFDKPGFAPTFLYGIDSKSPELSVVLKRGIVLTGTVKRTVGTQKEPVLATTVELQLPYVDLWYQQRTLTDHEGKYMFHVTPPPPGRKWQVVFAGEVVPVDVNSTWSTGPDFEVSVQVRNSNKTSSDSPGER